MPSTISTYKSALALPIKLGFMIYLSGFPISDIMKGMNNESSTSTLRTRLVSKQVLEFLSTSRFDNPNF